MIDVAGGLIGLGVIKQEQLDAAVGLAPGIARTLPGRLAAVGVDADELARGLSTLSGLAVLPSGLEQSVAPLPLPGVDPSALRQLVAAPLGVKDGLLHVAVADPGTAQHLSQLGLPAHRVYLAPEALVLRALDRLAPAPAPFPPSTGAVAFPAASYVGTERDLAFEDDGASLALADARPARARPPTPAPAPAPAPAAAWVPDPEPAFAPLDAGPGIAPMSLKAAQAKIAAQAEAEAIPLVASPFDEPAPRASAPPPRAPAPPPAPPLALDVETAFPPSGPAPQAAPSDAERGRPLPPPSVRPRPVTAAPTAVPPPAKRGGRTGVVVGAVVAVLAVAGGAAALLLGGKGAPPAPVVVPAATPSVVDPLEARQKEALAEARKKLAAKDLTAAVEAFSAAVDVDPASPLAYEALVGRGDARAANLDTAGAQSDYKRALNGLSASHPMRAQAEAGLAKLPTMSP